MAGKRGMSGPPGNNNARSHGLTVLKRAVNGLGNRVIDKRTATGKALAKWRDDLVEDLGGNDISTQKSALVDLAVKSKLLLDSVDTWLLTQPTLVNARKRSLIPVVLQRQQLADSLAKHLNMLGLERRHKVKTISDLLSDHDRDTTPAPETPQTRHAVDKLLPDEKNLKSEPEPEPEPIIEIEIPARDVKQPILQPNRRGLLAQPPIHVRLPMNLPHAQNQNTGHLQPNSKDDTAPEAETTRQ